MKTKKESWRENKDRENALWWSILRSRDKYHLTSMLLRDLLQQLGVDVNDIFDAPKDQVAQWIYSYGRYKNVEFKLIAPCSNCPFRSDRRFYLRKERAVEISQSILTDKTFICHKTANGEYVEDEKTGEETYINGENEQHCAGALITLAKAGQLWDNFLYRLAVKAGIFDPDKLKVDSPVYATLEDFVNAAD